MFVYFSWSRMSNKGDVINPIGKPEPFIVFDLKHFSTIYFDLELGNDIFDPVLILIEKIFLHNMVIGNLIWNGNIGILLP